jgi:hypothetical protein
MAAVEMDLDVGVTDMIGHMTVGGRRFVGVLDRNDDCGVETMPRDDKGPELAERFVLWDLDVVDAGDAFALEENTKHF